MAEVSNMERLAVAQAVYKKVGKYVSTKDPDSLRSECDREFLQMFEDTGVDRTQVRVNGVKVGTYSARETKPVERARVVVDDPDAFLRWCVREGYVVPDRDAVQQALERDGVVPEGAHVVTETVAGSVGTVLRVDEDKVVEALAGRLPGTVALMLEVE